MSFKRRDKIAIALVTGLVAIVVASALIGFVMIQVHANESPYDSGRDHGCSDAGKDPDNRYINRDGNGPDNHTNEFMDGYNDGYDSCSGSGNTDSSGASDDGDNEQSQSQSQSQAMKTRSTIAYQEECDISVDLRHSNPSRF